MKWLQLFYPSNTNSQLTFTCSKLSLSCRNYCVVSYIFPLFHGGLLERQILLELYHLKRTPSDFYQLISSDPKRCWDLEKKPTKLKVILPIYDSKILKFFNTHAVICTKYLGHLINAALFNANTNASVNFVNVI